MRYFNPTTMTEAISGLHDLTGCTELDDDNWFFSTAHIPKGYTLSTHNSAPVLIDASGTVTSLAAAQAAAQAAEQAAESTSS